MNEQELKPCPFCGGESEMAYVGGYGRIPRCMTPGCLLETGVGAVPAREADTIAAWNNRVNTSDTSDRNRYDGSLLPEPSDEAKETAEAFERFLMMAGDQLLFDGALSKLGRMFDTFAAEAVAAERARIVAALEAADKRYVMNFRGRLPSPYVSVETTMSIVKGGDA